MKYLLAIITFTSFGCNHNSKVIEAIDYPIPPPPPNILPYNFPPNFTPDMTQLAEVQINPLPHPFNLNGNVPYAIWVNGKRLSLNNTQVKELAHALNLKFKQPKGTAQIHSGEGWLHPLPFERLGLNE